MVLPHCIHIRYEKNKQQKKHGKRIAYVSGLSNTALCVVVFFYFPAAVSVIIIMPLSTSRERQILKPDRQ